MMDEQPQPVELTADQITTEQVRQYVTALARDVVTTHQGNVDLFGLYNGLRVLTLEVDAIKEVMLELAPDRVLAEVRLHEHFRRLLQVEIAKLERPGILLNGRGR